jgi:hypothetical protein
VGAVVLTVSVLTLAAGLLRGALAG